MSHSRLLQTKRSRAKSHEGTEVGPTCRGELCYVTHRLQDLKSAEICLHVEVSSPHSQCAEVLSKGWQQIFMSGERNVTTSLKPTAPSLRILWAHLRPLKAGRLPVNPRAPAANSPTPGSGSSRLWRSTCVSFSSLAPLAGMRLTKEELCSHFCSLHL